MNHSSGIDGLKALAVIGIVLYHYDTGLAGGFIGVDVAFVIAGFLIAAGVRSEVAAGSFSFASFYEQGARRTLPALFVMLAFVLGPAFFLMQPAEFGHTARSGAFAALGAGNIFFFLDSNYFNPRTAELPLLHTWPVAVVEQFYLVAPVLIVLMRKAQPVLALAAIAVLAAVSFLWSTWYLGVSQTGGFYLMPARAWELLAGSMLAFAPRPKLKPALASAIGIAGLAMIVFAAVTYNALMFYPGKKALLPLLGAMAAVYSLETGGGVVAKVLGSRPVAFVGKVSYSWFLWHWPLIAFYKYLHLGDGALWPKLILMAVSFALAAASWRFIEQPFAHRKADRRPLAPVTPGA